MSEADPEGHQPSFVGYVHWRHELGPAHCLARYFETEDGPVCVLSEVRSNDMYRSMMDDLPQVAAQVLSRLEKQGHSPVPGHIRWLAHYGDFSSHDPSGYPETLTELRLIWENGEFRDDIARHELLGSESAFVLDQLEPIRRVVGRLGPPQ